MNQLAPILHTMGTAAVFGQLARTEIPALRGTRGVFIGLIHAALASRALVFLEQALTLAGCATLPPLVGRVVYATPIVVSYFAGKRIENDSLRTSVVFAQNHFSKLCQTISLISCVAIIYFGNPVSGITGLLVLGIGVCERNQWIGKKIREPLRTYVDPLVSFTALASSDWFNRIWAALDLLTYVIPSNPNEETPVKTRPPGNLSLAQLQKMLPSLQNTVKNETRVLQACVDAWRQSKPSSNIVLQLLKRVLYGAPSAEDRSKQTPDVTTLRFWVSRAQTEELQSLQPLWPSSDKLDIAANSYLAGSYEINREYVHFEALPPPDGSIDTHELSRMVETAAANDRRAGFIQALRGQLRDDERTKQGKEAVDKLSDDALFKQYIENFRTYITQVATRTIPEVGTLEREYVWLEDNLRRVISGLRALEDPVSKLDSLVSCVVRLPYCTSGKIEAIERLRDALLLQNNSPFPVKILKVLEQSRSQLVHRGGQWIPSTPIVDVTQMHSYNTFVNGLSLQKLGISNASARDDELAQFPGIYTLCVEKLAPLGVHKAFWEMHTAPQILEVVRDSIGPGKVIRYEALIMWWRGWITRQPISDLEKRALHEELDQWKVLGIDLVDENNRCNPVLLYALLMDMGIINIPS